MCRVLVNLKDANRRIFWRRKGNLKEKDRKEIDFVSDTHPEWETDGITSCDCHPRFRRKLGL